MLTRSTVESLRAQADLFADRKFAVDQAGRQPETFMVFSSSYISGPEHAVNPEQSLYYSSVQKITDTACFNFIGAAKAELEVASLDLFIPVLLDDHQVSLPNSIPVHYFGLRFKLLLVI